jgi:transcriptional regulator with XRE-family HTH domain
MDMETMTDRLAEAIAPLIAAGISQTDLARRIGVTRATVGDWVHKRAASLRITLRAFAHQIAEARGEYDA